MLELSTGFQRQRKRVPILGPRLRAKRGKKDFVPQNPLCKNQEQSYAVDSVLRRDGGPGTHSRQRPNRVLWYRPMAWVGVIRPTRKDEAWPASLWQTFFELAVVHTYRQLHHLCLPRLVAASVLPLMPLVVMLARVLLNLVQRRRMIGQSSNWLSSCAPPPRSRPPTLPEAGVRSVETSNLMSTLPTLQDLHPLSWTCASRMSALAAAPTPPSSMALFTSVLHGY